MTAPVKYGVQVVSKLLRNEHPERRAIRELLSHLSRRPDLERLAADIAKELTDSHTSQDIVIVFLILNSLLVTRNNNRCFVAPSEEVVIECPTGHAIELYHAESTDFVTMSFRCRAEPSNHFLPCP